MSCSKLENSEASTNINNILESLEIESNHDRYPQHTPKNQKTVEVIYYIIMTAISALILKRHSKHWKRWTSILSAIIFLIGRVTLKQEK